MVIAGVDPPIVLLVPPKVKFPLIKLDNALPSYLLMMAHGFRWSLHSWQYQESHPP